ncbi:MAG: DUF58 domain-containing protein [Phycisphaerae bacterium]|nr:DUF58 domain-containing protein [Phycisphaerae bacterium]
MARRKKKTRSNSLRVTGPGWVFLSLSLMVGLAAVRSHMPMLFVIFGAMLGSLAISSILARGMISGVAVHRDLPDRAWQYESVYFGYFLRNTQRWFSCLGIELSEIVPRGIDDARGYCVHLAARSVFRAGSRLAAARRGRIELQGVRISTNFPFGLVVVRRDMFRPTSMVVWPAKGHITSDLLMHGAMVISTAQPGRMQGGQDEFFGLRDYRQGDNPRWIHWRRSAGRQTPVVREMAHPVPDSLFVILDIPVVGDDSSAFLWREKMLRFAATLIEQALRRGYQVALALAGEDKAQVVLPGTSVGVRVDLLDCLADVQEPGVDFQMILKVVDASDIRSAQVILVSDRFEEIDSPQLKELARTARHMEVLNPEQLDAVFQENPLIETGQKEEA